MKKLSDQVIPILQDGVKRCGNAMGLARLSGCSPANISRWMNGGRTPTIAEFSNVLLALGYKIVAPDEKMADYDLVPKVVAKAGAGASLETNGDLEGLYAFRKDFMCIEHISPTRSVLMDVVGDSMEPLFSEGDTLLVDKSDVDLMDGKIYVVTLGDELRVKRIHKSVNGLILRSENPRYPDIPVEGPDLESFLVHGRVRWCGKVF